MTADESGLCANCTRALERIADDLRALTDGLDDGPREELDIETQRVPEYVF